jgi:hypothetical protein
MLYDDLRVDVPAPASSAVRDGIRNRKYLAMDAIAMLGSEHEIHAIATCCENLVSGRRIVEMKTSRSSR